MTESVEQVVGETAKWSLVQKGSARSDFASSKTPGSFRFRQKLRIAGGWRQASSETVVERISVLPSRRSRLFMERGRTKMVGSLLFWLFCHSIAIAAEQYTLDAAHSELTFQVRQFVSSVTGKFTDFAGTVIFNRAQPERSSVEATIRVQSIDTGIEERDHHLLSPEFFDVQKFPSITFKSVSVDRTSERTADVHGNLTMHGVTRPVLLHVELLSDHTNKSADSLRWRVTANLKRKSFGLAWNAFIEASQAVGDDISIRMRIVTPAR
jgi:polyisoprenoid-binding protein YceI